MLEALVARPTEPAGLVRRARVILLSATGESGAEIALRLDLSPEAVSRIRRRFVREGVDGLWDRPKAGRRDHAVPADTVENERRIAEATSREEGKPEAALPKIVEGRVNGFFKDVVLLEQPSVQESKKSVQQVLEAAGTTVSRFARFEVGA